MTPNLATRLKALGLTQREFAAATGVSVSQVNRWSVGEYETPTWVWRLLDAWEELARVPPGCN